MRPFALCLLISGWVASPGRAQAAGGDSSLASRYAFLNGASNGRRYTAAQIERAVGLDSIVFKRGPCYGTCPVYQVTLHSNGTARFIGGAFASRDGTWIGRFDRYEYARLAYMIEL